MLRNITLEKDMLVRPYSNYLGVTLGAIQLTHKICGDGEGERWEGIILAGPYEGVKTAHWINDGSKVYDNHEWVPFLLTKVPH